MKNSVCFRIIFLLFVLWNISCSKEAGSPDSSLANLPKDEGGLLKAVYYNSAINTYGYYIYTPSSYNQNKYLYPLLISLHGTGEIGNSMTDTTTLKKLLNNGLPSLIKNKKWSPRYPMIVVSPQCHDSWWDAKKIHQFIGSIINRYGINTNRIYLTGLSMGGYGTYSYVETYSDTGYVAAVVPVCGGGNTSKASKYLHIPLWAFHGDADNTVYPINSIDMVNAINALNPAIKAKLTIYPGVGHDSWSRTYDGSGMGTESKSYDPFEMSIYDWMFQYTK
jgi:predicted peptidase